MFKFGIPKKIRTVKVEKYPETAVITMLEIPESGKGYKFDINPKAQELMGLELTGEEHIDFAFPDDNSIFVAKLDEGIRVIKTGTTSGCKPMYEFISDRLGLDNSVINEFEITHFEDNIFKMELMNSESLEEIDNLNQMQSELEKETVNDIN